jgi:hypothetical protein
MLLSASAGGWDANDGLTVRIDALESDLNHPIGGIID